VKTPIRYAGGKSKAYNIITERIPKMLLPKRIISPFMGGGSLESRWSSDIGIEVISYDIFDALTNFWNVLLTNPAGLADKLALLSPTKNKYKEIKEILIQWDYTQEMLSEWKTDYYKRDSITLDNLTAAAYYYHNHNRSCLSTDTVSRPSTSRLHVLSARRCDRAWRRRGGLIAVVFTAITAAVADAAAFAVAIGIAAPLLLLLFLARLGARRAVPREGARRPVFTRAAQDPRRKSSDQRVAHRCV
jgi:hypothetical protein